MPKQIISLPARKWGFISDIRLRRIVARDYAELRRLQMTQAYKSTILLCGSILEALLVYVLTSEGAQQKHKAKYGHLPNVRKIEDDGLKNLISRATDLGLLNLDAGNQAGIVKDYRNLIHPLLERQSQVDISVHSVTAILGLFNNMIHVLVKSAGHLPTSGHQGKAAFFEELSKHVEPGEVQVIHDIHDWAGSNGLEQAWRRSLTYLPLLHHPAGIFKLFAISAKGAISIRFGYLLRTKSAFRSRECRLELLQRLNAIPGVHIGLAKVDKFPSIRPRVLRDQAARQQFLEVLDWMKATIVLPPTR